MTPLQKSKLFSYVVLVIISLLEIGLFTLLLTAYEFPFFFMKMFFIVAFIMLFNGAIWYWREKYDAARLYYTEQTQKEKNDA